MRRAPRIGLCVGLLSLSAAGGVGAQAPAEAPTSERYRLSWVRGKGAEECPGAEQLAAAVRQRLGRDPFASDAPRDIEGSVARVDDYWQARLNVLGSEGAVLGSRDLSTRAPTCALLADAVTLAIALTIDPSAPLTPPENVTPPAPIDPLPSPTAPVAPEPVAEPTPSPVPAPTPRERPPAPSTFGIGANAKGSILFGSLPRPAPGGELGVDLRLARPVRLTLGLAFFGEVKTAGDDFAIGLTAASLGACYDVLNNPKVGLDACADLQAGALHVVVYSPDPTSPGEYSWLAARLGPRLRWRFAPPVELALGGSAVVPFVARDFGVKDQPRPLFETPPVGFCAGVGLGAFLP